VSCGHQHLNKHRRSEATSSWLSLSGKQRHLKTETPPPQPSREVVAATYTVVSVTIGAVITNAHRNFHSLADSTTTPRAICHHHPHSLQPQPHTSTTVEEGIRRKLPSSSEIYFPAEPVNIRKRHAYQHPSAPQTMQNRTSNYVEAHLKRTSNRTRNNHKNQNRPQKTNRTASPRPQKNFSQRILTLHHVLTIP